MRTWIGRQRNPDGLAGAFTAIGLFAVAERLRDWARRWTGGLLQLYFHQLESVEAGSYFGLPPVPDGMPVGVLVLLAAFVVARKARGYVDVRGQAS